MFPLANVRILPGPRNKVNHFQQDADDCRADWVLSLFSGMAEIVAGETASILLRFAFPED
jgi:hypothetical protein